jgi:PAS domain S-box-containing protein
LELTKLSLESDDPSLTVTTMLIPSDALKLLSDQPFDCIVSDYQMPGMDGTKFCTEIKKTRTIPFIIYTGRGSEEIAYTVFTAGADDYVKKEKELAHFKVLARRIRHAVEKNRAENALKVSEERYRTLFSNMMDGFAYCRMIYDQNGKPEDFIYLEVNDAFERLTGLRREKIVGRKVSEAMPGIREGNPELIDIYGRVSSTGVPESLELFLKPLSIWLYLSIYSPEKGYFVAIFDNITQRKKAEEWLAATNEKLSTTNEGLQASNTELAMAREKVQEHAKWLEEVVEERTAKLRESEESLRRIQQMDTISRIGATVAHDLRGPLIAIGQAAEMASKKQELSDMMLEMISRNVERSLHMIEAFREGTREVKVVKRKVELSSLVKEVVDGVPKPENISLDMRLGEGLEDVSLDPELMRRVLDNLVRNGFEAMPDGVKLTVSARRVVEEVVMEVGDTGVGISEEASKHIFEPLFTTKKGGLGLGLYFVKMVVEGHGGKVDFVSKPGEGTTFTIRLPTQ